MFVPLQRRSLNYYRLVEIAATAIALTAIDGMGFSR
jgi:hypothetical protein